MNGIDYKLIHLIQFNQQILQLYYLMLVLLIQIMVHYMVILNHLVLIYHQCHLNLYYHLTFKVLQHIEDNLIKEYIVLNKHFVYL